MFFENKKLKFNMWLDTGVITWPGYHKVTCHPRCAAGRWLFHKGTGVQSDALASLLALSAL